MKFGKTIAKNLKLLMRAKSSAFIVIFGPLLIMLLMGLALNKPTTYEISIGYYTSKDNNDLTNSFIEELKNNNFLVTEYDNNETCIHAIKQGTAHTCIIFPQDFTMGDPSHNQVDFYVDYSRANLVYQIIDTVSSELELRTSELSKDLTQILINKIENTRSDIDEDIMVVITIKSNIDSVVSELGDTRSKSESLDLSMDSISLNSISSLGSDIYNDAKDLKSEGTAAVTEGKSLLGNNDTGNLDDIQDEIDSIYNDTADMYDEFNDMVDNATSKIEALKDKLEDSQSKNQEVLTSLDDITSSLEGLKTSTDNLKSNMEATNEGLTNINITSAESIVSPIKTEIKPIVAETNQLVFFFPMLIVLVIMFIGIMLSSTLIIMEKKSKAAFRNFTTPTKDSFFITTTFITSFIILLVQEFVLLGLSYYFLKADILTNIWMTAVILLITTSIFILIGMMIGYASTTQEAATMMSIALGSIFLLLSNLILPIETMSKLIKNIVSFNPYVISSELLKKSMLFNLTSIEAIVDIGFLSSFMIAMMMVVFIVNKMSKIKIIQKTPHVQKKGFIYVPEDAYLKIDHHIIKNKKDILRVLQELTPKEFKDHVQKRNEIANWVSQILKEKKLAWKLRFKSKEQMIKVMKKNLNKEKKNAEKQQNKIEKST